MTTIGQADIQRMLVEISGKVGNVEGQLGTFIGQMAKQDERTTDLEVRTRKVENRQHWYSGVGAAAGVLLGFFGRQVSGH